MPHAAHDVAHVDHYPINHRPKSVIFVKQRLAHVRRILGAVLISDLTETRVREYITTRLAELAGGRTINMELGELTRSIGHKWSALWPKVRKLEENHGIGRALSAEEENRLLSAAARDDSPNRNPAMYPILCIALSTGMRSGEIEASLRWSNIDLKTAMLTTGRAKTAAGTGRQIPINTQPGCNPCGACRLVPREDRRAGTGLVCLSRTHGPAETGRAAAA